MPSCEKLPVKIIVAALQIAKILLATVFTKNLTAPILQVTCTVCPPPVNCCFYPPTSLESFRFVLRCMAALTVDLL